MKREVHPPKNAQALLLSVLWKIFGGNRKVARILKIHEQMPVNWKLRGHVPLTQVGHVARLLKVPPEALNYEEVVRLKGGGLTWRECVTEVLSKGRELGNVKYDTLYQKLVHFKSPKKVSELV